MRHAVGIGHGGAVPGDAVRPVCNKVAERRSHAVSMLIHETTGWEPRVRVNIENQNSVSVRVRVKVWDRVRVRVRVR